MALHNINVLSQSSGSLKTKIKMSAGPCYFRSFWGRILPCFFLASGSCWYLWIAGCTTPISVSIFKKVAFFPLCVIGTPVILDLGTTLMQYDFILTNYSCGDIVFKDLVMEHYSNALFFIVQKHSTVLTCILLMHSEDWLKHLLFHMCAHKAVNFNQK